MKTIATNDAKTNLSRYLDEVSKGATIVITRGRRPLAMLVPFRETGKLRPKVGQTMDTPAPIPDDAFKPLERHELEAWGL